MAVFAAVAVLVEVGSRVAVGDEVAVGVKVTIGNAAAAASIVTVEAGVTVSSATLVTAGATVDVAVTICSGSVVGVESKGSAWVISSEAAAGSGVSIAVAMEVVSTAGWGNVAGGTAVSTV